MCLRIKCRSNVIMAIHINGMEKIARKIQSKYVFLHDWISDIFESIFS